MRKVPQPPRHGRPRRECVATNNAGTHKARRRQTQVSPSLSLAARRADERRRLARARHAGRGHRLGWRRGSAVR